MAPKAPGGFSDPLARRRGGGPTGKGGVSQTPDASLGLNEKAGFGTAFFPQPGSRPGPPRGPAGPASIFIFQALKPEIFILFFNPSKYS